jgi:hypothetical protein
VTRFAKIAQKVKRASPRNARAKTIQSDGDTTRAEAQADDLLAVGPEV